MANARYVMSSCHSDMSFLNLIEILYQNGISDFSNWMSKCCYHCHIVKFSRSELTAFHGFPPPKLAVLIDLFSNRDLQMHRTTTINPWGAIFNVLSRTYHSDAVVKSQAPLTDIRDSSPAGMNAILDALEHTFYIFISCVRRSFYIFQTIDIC